MPVDHSGIGSAYRDVSEKAFVKATAAGLVLIMAHLLGIQPSEITALGLRLEIKSPQCRIWLYRSFVWPLHFKGDDKGRFWASTLSV